MAIEEKDPLTPDADLKAKLREIDRIAERDRREAQRRLDAMSEEEKRQLRRTQKNFLAKMSAGLEFSSDSREDT